MYRVTGAGGESRIVKLLAWPSDGTQAAGGGGGACAPGECGPDRIGSMRCGTWGCTGVAGMDFDSGKGGRSLAGGSQYGVIMEDGGRSA